ncbi:phage tail tape measure protein [Lysinibacillus sphaericus]|uniref:phage tail tape measure protein n=2 Tax=Lysinibacillus sphaericus TaxID=1421 RepID=UPI002162110D|nr:phage tail tape measure protein [Lysinibacillus sphaericus]MCS1383266.1 phage tail tape measure protein [Lysinibacillus sphaericus]
MANRVISAVLTLQDRDFSSNLRRASDRADDFGRGVVRVGNQIQRFGQGATRVFKSVAMGAGALGATGIAAFGASVAKSIVDTDGAFKRLEARTGATGAELKGLENVAKDVFKAGFGENMDQVADDVSTLSAMFKNLKGDSLTEVAKGAATISQAWGSESKEVGRAVQAMTNNFNGLGENKALDLMTFAFQKTGDYSDDLLDTFSEYSMHFSKLGLSAEEFTGILIRGAENGAFNMDFVADGVKELGIRVIDESKTTAEGFKAIGFNAEEMANKFAAGGEEANTAFQATIAGLAAMKNPIERNAAGVALFGTKWEDVREDVILSMADSAAAVEGFEGATGRAADALQSSFKSKLTQSWRELQTGIADVVNGAGAQEFLQGVAQKADELVPKIQGIVEKAFEFGNTVRENWGPIKETLIGVSTAAGVLAVGMGTLKVITTVTTMVQGFKTAMGLATAGQWAMNTAMLASPLTWVVIGIAAVVAAGVLLYRNWDVVKQKASELWQRLLDNPMLALVAGPIGALIAAGITLYQNWDKVRAGWDTTWNTIKSAAGSGVNFVIDKLNGLIKVINKIPGVNIPIVPKVSWGDVKTGVDSINKASAGGKVPQYDVGSNRIEEDHLAQIHKGEMIIPARQAERVRAAGGNIDNIDKMVQPSPVAVATPTTTGSTPQPATANNSNVQVIIQNLNAKGVTPMEVANELVPLLKLRLANL